MKTTLSHKWQDLGYKPAYRLRGMYSIPSPSLAEHNPNAYNNALRSMPRGYGIGSCSVCGRGITHNYLMEDAEGKKFAVGSECVRHSDSVELITEVEAVRKEMLRKKREEEREARWAKRQAAYEAKVAANLAAERERNGGLTDEEVREQQKQEKRRANHVANQWIVDALADCWMTQTIGQLRAGHVSIAELHEGTINRLADCYGQKAGRRNSKAYKAALEEFWEKVEQKKDA